MRALLFTVLIACGDDASTPDGGARDGGTDAGSRDAAASDAGADAGSDAGGVCGDAVVDPGEGCDQETVACTTLARAWTGGDAACRADCSGFEVSACDRAMGDAFELVEPATRDPGRFAAARCNDGSPFDFEVRLAAAPSSEWVIYLQGGVYCDDVSFSCAARSMNLVTSLPPADGTVRMTGHEGVLSRSPAVNPAHATANHVYAHYCSSDFWAGATDELRPSSGSAGGWYYSGHLNVRAMLAILRARFGLDDGDPSTRVLFGGGSAGAFGAHFNASEAEAALPSAAAAGRLLLFIDAGWMTDWDDAMHRLGTSSLPDREVWRAAREFWAASFDPACEAAEPEPADCFFGPTWYPHVSARLPILVQQSSIDSSFMGVHGIGAGDPTATAWRAEVEASLADVDWLFSGDASYHVLATGDAGMRRGPAGSTLADVLQRFWMGSAPERVEW